MAQASSIWRSVFGCFGLAPAKSRAELSGFDIVRASDLTLEDNVLSWSHSASPAKATLDELVFVLQPSKAHAGSPRYILSILREIPDKPFQLLLIGADAIPSGLERFMIHDIPSQLSQDNGNLVQVIVSTKSGLGQAQKFWQGILEPLLRLTKQSTQQDASRRDDAQQVLVTNSQRSISKYGRELQGLARTEKLGTVKSRTIILLSGDGGMVDLLNGLDDLSEDSPRPLVAVLPLGTGNALFHSLHKPLYEKSGASPLVIALRTLFRGAPVELPIFRTSFSEGSTRVTFPSLPAEGADAENQRAETPESQIVKEVTHLNGAIVASYGFHASIVYESDTPEYRKHGDKRFGMVAQQLLKESHPYMAQVEVRRTGAAEFEPLPRDTHTYILATMVSNLERTFTISPESKPLDDKLRLVHFGPVGGDRTMKIMMAAYDNGKHIGMKFEDGEEVGYEEVEEIRVTTSEENERWRKVCVDGTIVELPQNGSMTVRRQLKGPARVLVGQEIAHS